jgi:hypothetical protein
MGNQFTLFHTMIAQLHRSRKIFEGSLELGCASHPHKLFLISTDLQRGIELPNDSLILVLPEPQNLCPTHSFEGSHQTIHVIEDLKIWPAHQPLLFRMHWPHINATTVQPILTEGLKEGSQRIPCFSKVPGQCQLAELSYNTQW